MEIFTISAGLLVIAGHLKICVSAQPDFPVVVAAAISERRRRCNASVFSYASIAVYRTANSSPESFINILVA